jgi:hypothetical protein
MKKCFYLLLLLVSFAGPVLAQDNSFLLYSFKGNVTVIENKAESKAKIGKTLNETASVKLAPGALATFICNEAAMFTLTKAGTYSLSKLSDSCQSHAGSLTSNYVKYVWNQMTKSTGSPGSNRKAFMNNLGAVTRDVNNIWIDPRLDTVNYTGGDFPLSWKCYSDDKDYDFMLYSSDNAKTPIYKTTVEKLKVNIPSFVSKMQPGKSYFWTAAVKGQDNENLKVIHFMNKGMADALVADFKKQGPPTENTAEQDYRIAFMLEDSHYLAEALQYYTKAAAADPTNMLFRSTLMSFKKDYEIK